MKNRHFTQNPSVSAMLLTSTVRRGRTAEVLEGLCGRRCGDVERAYNPEQLWP